MLHALLVQPGRTPKEVSIKNSLKTLQNAVGGTITAIYPFEDDVAIIANDDGKLSGLPLNRSLRLPDGKIYDIIAGDFLVVGLSKDNFSSLTAELQKKYTEYFYCPEIYLMKENEIISIPVYTDRGDE